MYPNKCLNTKSENIYLSTPDESWSTEAVKLYDSIESNDKWNKCYPVPNATGEPIFTRAMGNKGFIGAFYCEEEKLSKGVVTFGPWTTGGSG